MRLQPRTLRASAASQQSKEPDNYFVVFNYDGSKNFSVYVASSSEEAEKFINCRSMRYSSILGTFKGSFYRDICDLQDNRTCNEAVNCQKHNIDQPFTGDRR